MIYYHYAPAPLANPQGRLDGAWIVRKGGPRGKVVARFQADGRDQAEAFIHRRTTTIRRSEDRRLRWTPMSLAW